MEKKTLPLPFSIQIKKTIIPGVLSCCAALICLLQEPFPTVHSVLCFHSDVSQRIVLRNYLTSSVPEIFRKNLLETLTETEGRKENRLKTASTGSYFRECVQDHLSVRNSGTAGFSISVSAPEGSSRKKSFLILLSSVLML